MGLEDKPSRTRGVDLGRVGRRAADALVVAALAVTARGEMQKPAQAVNGEGTSPAAATAQHMEQTGVERSRNRGDHGFRAVGQDGRMATRVARMKRYSRVEKGDAVRSQYGRSRGRETQTGTPKTAKVWEETGIAEERGSAGAVDVRVKLKQEARDLAQVASVAATKLQEMGTDHEDIRALALAERQLKNGQWVDSEGRGKPEVAGVVAEAVRRLGANQMDAGSGESWNEQVAEALGLAWEKVSYLDAQTVAGVLALAGIAGGLAALSRLEGRKRRKVVRWLSAAVLLAACGPGKTGGVSRPAECGPGVGDTGGTVGWIYPSEAVENYMVGQLAPFQVDLVGPPTQYFPITGVERMTPELALPENKGGYQAFQAAVLEVGDGQGAIEQWAWGTPAGIQTEFVQWVQGPQGEVQAWELGQGPNGEVFAKAGTDGQPIVRGTATLGKGSCPAQMNPILPSGEKVRVDFVANVLEMFDPGGVAQAQVEKTATATATVAATATNVLPKETLAPTAMEGPKWGELAPIMKDRVVPADVGGELLLGGKLTMSVEQQERMHDALIKALAEGVMYREFMQNLLGVDNPTAADLQHYLDEGDGCIPTENLPWVRFDYGWYIRTDKAGRLFPGLSQICLTGERVVAFDVQQWQNNSNGVGDFVNGLRYKTMSVDDQGGIVVGFGITEKGEVVLVGGNKNRYTGIASSYVRNQLGNGSGKFDPENDSLKLEAYFASLFMGVNQIEPGNKNEVLGPLYDGTVVRRLSEVTEEMDYFNPR